MEIKIQQQGDSQGKNSNKENNFNAACKKMLSCISLV